MRSRSSSSVAPTAQTSPTATPILTTMTTTAAVPSAPGAALSPRPRKARTGLKRTKFQVPSKMPLPVRALWVSASPEEQTKAHQAATAILRTWLGKATREEAATELGLSRLRFWQLSQQAVAGLVAGLLRQPRFRGRAGPTGEPLEEGVGVLRRKITTLERELDGAKRLIALLKELPAPRVAGQAAGTERCDGSKRRGRGRGGTPAAAEPGAGAGAGTEARHGAS